MQFYVCAFIICEHFSLSFSHLIWFIFIFNIFCHLALHVTSFSFSILGLSISLFLLVCYWIFYRWMSRSLSLSRIDTHRKPLNKPSSTSAIINPSFCHFSLAFSVDVVCRTCQGVVNSLKINSYFCKNFQNFYTLTIWRSTIFLLFSYFASGFFLLPLTTERVRMTRFCWYLL